MGVVNFLILKMSTFLLYSPQQPTTKGVDEQCSYTYHLTSSDVDSDGFCSLSQTKYTRLSYELPQTQKIYQTHKCRWYRTL